MRLYQVIKVTDVQKVGPTSYNSQWAISNSVKTDTFIEVEDDPKEVCKRLKELKFIDSADLRKVAISDLSKDLIEVRTKKDLKPLCRLESAKWIVH